MFDKQCETSLDEFPLGTQINFFRKVKEFQQYHKTKAMMQGLVILLFLVIIFFFFSV